MIPKLDEHGYLPPGIHVAGLEEIAIRFGQQSELRQVQMESLRWLVDLAKRAAVRRLVINGSFVTDALEPNDVDCVLLIDPDFQPDPIVSSELEAGLPFLEISVAKQPEFDELVQKIFATDRHTIPKGMVEVIL